MYVKYKIIFTKGRTKKWSNIQTFHGVDDGNMNLKTFLKVKIKRLPRNFPFLLTQLLTVLKTIETFNLKVQLQLLN